MSTIVNGLDSLSQEQRDNQNFVITSQSKNKINAWGIQHVGHKK